MATQRTVRNRREGARLRSPVAGHALTAFAAVWLLATAALPPHAVSNQGLVESGSGGLKFPDGSVQMTAAAPAPIGDTGQQACWDVSGDPISCTGTGQDGETQAGVDWPTPRFSDNGDGTITDELTGLLWLEAANCFGAMNWADALAAAAALADGQCGLTDGSTPGQWRVPNIKELVSLLDLSQTDPPLPASHPFVGVTTSFYGTSSTVVSAPEYYWALIFGQGNSIQWLKAGGAVVWPVRSVP